MAFGLDYRDVYSALGAGRYLTALRKMNEGRGHPDLARNVRLWTLNSVDPWGSAWETSGPGEAFDTSEAQTDADLPFEAIAAALRSHRAVVLMEAHRAPETTRFGTTLLAGLRAAGATHFAFESGLQEPLDQFQRTGALRPDTAVYSFEPARAELLRSARRLGMRLLAFDFATTSQWRLVVGTVLRQLVGGPLALAHSAELNRRREEWMAENIAAVLADDRAARVVVWTGEQHAMRRMPPGSPWDHPPMAANLARLLGEEPFCIGQRLVDCDAFAKKPRVCAAQSSHWAQERGLDAVVLHHRGQQPAVPHWLEEIARAVKVEADGAALVQAVPAEEGDDAVPSDQRLTCGKAQTLLLRPGSYQLLGLAGDDKLLWRRPWSV